MNRSHQTLKAVRDTVGLVMETHRKATKYLAHGFVVKASRLHKPRRRERSATIVVTVGRPNHAERRFITAARKAGEPFPIRRIQLRGWK